MKRRIMYVELVTGHDHDGPAFIGWVVYSKTRKTIRVHGKSLERFHGGTANHFDTETEELYWVCNPKKDGKDRHELGSGPVHIDENAKEEYERHIAKK